jgi:hypothetical protein
MLGSATVDRQVDTGKCDSNRLPWLLPQTSARLPVNWMFMPVMKPVCTTTVIYKKRTTSLFYMG